MARDNKNPDWRKAYALAWGDRATHGTDQEVLAARLRGSGMGDLTDPSGSGSVIFDLWRREVPPNRLMLEFLKTGGNALVGIADAGLAIYRSFRSGEDFDFEIPAGKREVSDEIQNAIEVDLVFERGEGADAPFVEAMQARPSLRGWRTANVWLEMLPTPGRARVMMGTDEVGQTEITIDSWHHANAAERHGLYADGFLLVRPAKGGDFETGDMPCFLAPQKPIRFDE